MRRLAVLLALVATFAATATAEARQLVRYDVGGGIGGRSDRLAIERDGSARQRGDAGSHDFMVSSKQLRALKRELKAARFGTLKRRYEPDHQVFDGITQVVRYGGRSVSVSSGAEPPARFRRVIRRLSRLMRYR